MCFHRRVFAERIGFRTKAKPGDDLAVWNVEALIPYRCAWGEFPVRMPFPAFLLCPQSGMLLLFIQPAQLSSFRTMGFDGFSFSTDLPPMILWVFLSSKR
jgi:hypothetical protein